MLKKGCLGKTPQELNSNCHSLWLITKINLAMELLRSVCWGNFSGV